MATKYAEQYVTVYDMELRNKQAGQHWFDADAKRFFASRISEPVYPTPDGAKVYFVSSERYEREPRMYTVRVMDWDTGSVDTVGEFQEYKTSAAARKVAAQLAKS